MNKKWLMLAITLLFAVAIVSACGDKDDNNNNKNNNNEDNNTEENDENNTKDNDNNENNNDNNEENNDDAMKNIDEDDDNDNDNDNNDEKDNEIAIGDSAFKELIEYMEEETEGEASVLYESDKEQEHDMEGVNVKLDGYTLVELNDFNEWFTIPFDDQTDGAVVIAKYTIKNDTDDDLSYMPTLSMSYVGSQKNLDNQKDLIPEEEQIKDMLSPDDDYELKAGDEVTGYYTYPMGESRLQEILEVGDVQVEVPQPQEEADDYSSTLGEEGTFTLGMDEEGTAKNEEKESKGFYKDAITDDNMGEKTMLDEDTDFNKTEALRDVDVTLEGYQFTEFVPNKESEASFQSDNGIILLTVKFNIDNGSDSEIDTSAVSSKLIVNDGTEYMRNNNMLNPYGKDDIIEKGDKGDMLQVYSMDKEKYDKIWKDKSFEIEIGPMKDDHAQDISKGSTVEFDLK